MSPLHEACLGGHPACASVLLKHGAQVSITQMFRSISMKLSFPCRVIIGLMNDEKKTIGLHVEMSTVCYAGGIV